MSTLQSRFQQAMKGPPRVSQAALARACGVKPPSVHEWVKGDAMKLEANNLLAAAKKLGVRPEWLASGRGPMKASASETKLERATSALLHSYVLRLDPSILADTLYWVDYEEAHGPPYGPGDLLARIAELYVMHEGEPGGRLSTEQHNQLKEQGANRGDKKRAKRSKERESA